VPCCRRPQNRCPGRRIIAVLTPMTSPEDETSGPPELPGLSAASVWITSSIMRPVLARIERPSAEMTPAVTVDSKFERVADGDDQLAADQALGVAEPRDRQIARRVGADECEVGVRVFVDQLRVGRPPLRIGEADFLEAVDDVAVGEDQPVRRDDEARADAPSPAALLARLDVHHRRPDLGGHPRHRARIGVEERALVGGRRLRGRLARIVVENEFQGCVQHCLVPMARRARMWGRMHRSGRRRARTPRPRSL
jgi:hypothetical protein